MTTMTDAEMNLRKQIDDDFSHLKVFVATEKQPQNKRQRERERMRQK